MQTKKKIKVCHVVTVLDTGGMENGIVNLANNHDREKFEVHICCLCRAGEMAKRLKKHVSLHVLKERDGFSPARILRVARFFGKLQPDIVHAHAWGGGSLYGILGAKLARVPVIINGEHGSFFLRPHQVMLQKLIAAMCDVTLAVSESLKTQIVRNLGISPGRIKVIPNGVDTQLFSGEHDCSYLRTELRNKFGINIDGNSVVIGCVGSLKPIKNQMMLLKALLEVSGERTFGKIRVLFVGDGPDRPVLEEFVSHNHLNKNVVFLGNRDDVPQVLSLLDIFVLTSISEGMSNVILEAFSSSLPVIATKSIGAGELVKNGHNGFLVEQDDITSLSQKIALLSNDKASRKEMGHNARITVENSYSITRMVENYEKCYIDILRSK